MATLFNNPNDIWWEKNELKVNVNQEDFVQAP
jgi:hypothetical protein